MMAGPTPTCLTHPTTPHTPPLPLHFVLSPLSLIPRGRAARSVIVLSLGPNRLMPGTIDQPETSAAPQPAGRRRCVA